MVREETVKRNIIAVLAASVVIIVIYLLVPSYLAKPMGILLPAALPRASISVDQISFYDKLTAPYNYQNLGNINVQYYSRKLTLEEETYLKKCVMRIAAGVGANGIIITLFGHTVPDAASSIMSSYIFQGIAIYHSISTI